MSDKSKYFSKARETPEAISDTIDPAMLGYAGAGLLALVFALAVIWIVLRPKPRPKIAVDGSNVLYWENNVPSLGTVREVLARLSHAGYDPYIWFDANVGYLVSDRYLNERALGKMLRFPAGRIQIADKGTPADPLILAYASRAKVRVVTNDRFRDWTQEYAQFQDQRLFVRGSVKNGRAYFNFKK
ncbi:hypothetical protein FAP39_04635 [Shimia litoralis]|uniref:RNase NYN domain-containing protein n=1 Tax=Shimia litoralis TaxID=420403 RepID=A0A4U7N7L9_9RHOB|nr:hypothetical protein [Shimia litoralis]TKZ21890.1 hypothetical protein FAP39_04635 [Shimia litoralis]